MRLDNLPSLQAPRTPEKQYLDKIVRWWNDHDQGIRAFTSLTGMGSFQIGVNSVSASYVVAEYDSVILADSTGGVLTVTLPSAKGRKGQQFTVKDWKGQSATNNITIATIGGQTIDGGATKVLNVAYVSYTVTSDGANWAII